MAVVPGPPARTASNAPFSVLPQLITVPFLAPICGKVPSLPAGDVALGFAAYNRAIAASTLNPQLITLANGFIPRAIARTGLPISPISTVGRPTIMEPPCIVWSDRRAAQRLL